MTVIDHELDTVFYNDSIPINVGWEYRLMGKGDDYIEVVSIDGRYVTIQGVSGLTLEARILRSYFDNIVKEVTRASA